MRVIKEYMRFYDKFFSNIKRSGADEGEIIVTFSCLPVFTLDKVTPKFKAELLQFLHQSAITEKMPLQHMVANALFLLMRFWYKNRIIPSKHTEVYDKLYSYFLIELNRTPPATYEEAKESVHNGHDAYAQEVSRYAWYVLNSIKEGMNYERVKELAQVAVEKEKEIYGDEREVPSSAQTTFLSSLIDGLVFPEFAERNREVIESTKLTYGDIPIKDIALALRCDYDEARDAIIITKDNVLNLEYVLYNLERSYNNELKHEKHIKELTEDRESLSSAMSGAILAASDINKALEEDNITLEMENEALKHKLREAGKAPIALHGERGDDKAQLEILQLQTDKTRLQEEKAMLLEVIHNLESNVVAAVTKKRERKKKYPKKVSYFGVSNPQLVEMLKKRGITVEEYSATEFPSKKPVQPVFFNPAVAAHKIWQYIRDTSPIIVTGSNAEVIEKQIIDYLDSREE
jgi:hypothetical protein